MATSNLVNQGLSPRVRGNRQPAGETFPRRGSIPARAGEPCRLLPEGALIPVYPRACGGTASNARRAGSSIGLSPRVRGNHRPDADSRRPEGSIPARAGEPPVSSPPLPWCWVYPRACGGTAPQHHDRRQVGVYPRACGGTDDDWHWMNRNWGLSPRVRGNRPYPPAEGHQRGSIPARAGEPRCGPCAWWKITVYPRACGGTSPRPHRNRGRHGLSPRVRGNPYNKLRHWSIRGSIPARAGEPGTRTDRRTAAPVYPRACGGTYTVAPSAAVPSGLSPRVRGNHRPADDGHRLERSIPARAGEPPPAPTSRFDSPVYPRACGGTGNLVQTIGYQEGLSPRVRGNPRKRVGRQSPRRSIPARAGEPRLLAAWNGQVAVYPRACGGTARIIRRGRQLTGLSPRVRGNLVVVR